MNGSPAIPTLSQNAARIAKTPTGTNLAGDKSHQSKIRKKIGAPDSTRTSGLSLRRERSFQLSYGGIKARANGHTFPSPQLFEFSD